MSTTVHDSRIVRTRFAPSPSGHLHVGGARTALFCWAYAKGRASGAGGAGKFMLRIEDTDQKRSSEAASLGFLEDLKWLGILWDEGPMLEGIGGGDSGPYFQSERLEIYNRHLDQLLHDGKAYRAFDTTDELKAMREKAMAEKRNPRYDRAALQLAPETVEQFLKEGRPHVIRFKLPDGFGSVTVHDQVRGDVTVNESELDDFVIRKADGYPTYHFAVVVDDELMGVTHVIRAQEHLNNTHKHVLLQRAMGFRTPVYAHVSIITNPDGSKMSKRDKDKAIRAAVKQANAQSPPVDANGKPVITPDKWTWWLADKEHQLDLADAQRLATAMNVHLPEINVDDFRRNGYLPEVMLSYLALLGWSPGQDIEKFDAEFLKERFDFDRVIKTPAKFDREKLLSFNSDAMQAMPVADLAAKLEAHAARYHPDWHKKLAGKWALFARAHQKRAKTLEAPFQSDQFFLLEDDAPALIAFADDAKKALTSGTPSGVEHLKGVRPILGSLREWTVADMEVAVKGYAQAHAAGKVGNVAQPLRIAVSGCMVSPAIFDTLAVLGKHSTLARIDRTIAAIDCEKPVRLGAP
jgi:glutamyl/glutaminyl-tRNA synthetase